MHLFLVQPVGDWANCFKRYVDEIRYLDILMNFDIQIHTIYFNKIEKKLPVFFQGPLLGPARRTAPAQTCGPLLGNRAARAPRSPLAALALRPPPPPDPHLHLPADQRGRRPVGSDVYFRRRPPCTGGRARRLLLGTWRGPRGHLLFRLLLLRRLPLLLRRQRTTAATTPYRRTA